jgi:simple sugar transport system permease protein
LGIVATGVLFGALEAGAGAMQRDAGVPSVAVYVVEAVVILIAVLAEAARRRGAGGRQT